MKVFMMSGLGFGIILGVLSFLGAFLGSDVSVTFFDTVLTGPIAGVAALLVGPLTSVILFSLLGLISYVPFFIILRIKGKIDLMLRIRGE